MTWLTDLDLTYTTINGFVFSAFSLLFLFDSGLFKQKLEHLEGQKNLLPRNSQVITVNFPEWRNM